MMPKDEYGIGTCVGTGRRVARVSSFMLASGEIPLKDRLRVAVWVMQDRDEEMMGLLRPVLDRLEGEVDLSVTRMHDKRILPCMACDICPARVGPDEEFRCIRGATDQMRELHRTILEADVIVCAMYSPRDRDGLVSAYQHFLERTRYLRRGDYAFTDRLIVPLVLAEVGTNENLNLRMTTSLIRHHTVIHKPVMGWIHQGRVLNFPDVEGRAGRRRRAWQEPGGRAAGHAFGGRACCLVQARGLRSVTNPGQHAEP